MNETGPGDNKGPIIGCGSLVSAALICAVCATLGYFLLPENYTEFTVGGVNIAYELYLVEEPITPVAQADTTAVGLESSAIQPAADVAETATLRPTFTATPGPTGTPMPINGSPTLPLTDTPIPKTATPTAPPTNIPIPPTLTLEPDVQAQLEQQAAAPDLAATEVAEAILEILSGPEAIEGAISLVTLEHKYVFAPAPTEAEFSWTWSGTQGCDLPPEGYGFEVRVWPNRPDFGPLGIADAAAMQEEIVCDRQTGRRFYKIGFLSGTPAVKAQGAGSFLWDVAFVQLSPYTPLYASSPRIFEISLDYPNPGRYDPKGVAGVVKCKDFIAWSEAQAFFNAAGGNDPHLLDPDRNGVACDDIAPDLLKEQ